MLVALQTRNINRELVEEHLSELEELADTAGADSIFKIIQTKSSIDSAFYIGKGKAEFIADDLTHPDKLLQIAPVDLWIDRAVLHFFIQENDQDTYFELLTNKINSKGYALFAEYNMGGAKVCAGLPVHRYNLDMLTEKLGNDFELIDSFDHTFITPSGSERPYIYALFRKK